MAAMEYRRSTEYTWITASAQKDNNHVADLDGHMKQWTDAAGRFTLCQVPTVGKSICGSPSDMTLKCQEFPHLRASGALGPLAIADQAVTVGRKLGGRRAAVACSKA